jgi:hypothetical protein
VIAATIYFIAQDALLRLPWSLVAINLSSRGELSVTDVRGTRFTAAVLPGSFVAAYLSVLNFRLGSDDMGTRLQRRNFILTSERVDQDAFRRLRVWLRWRGEGAESESESE